MSLKQLYQQLQYQFNDEALCQLALTHRSSSAVNNERLEFLGDSVLSLIITQALYQTHGDKNEGVLSQMRSNLVNHHVLMDLAMSLSLSDYLILGPGEIKTKGQLRPSILENTLEALIGAIYLDSDLSTVRECVLLWYGERLYDIKNMQAVKDPKSLLQEYLQSKGLSLPHYTVEKSGVAHRMKFCAHCTVRGLTGETTGEANSRRQAEQIAAENFLKEVIDDDR